MSTPPLIVAFIVMIGIAFIMPSMLVKVGISNGLAVSIITSVLCLLAMILSVFFVLDMILFFEFL